MYNLYLNVQISISAARMHLCVQFVFKFSNVNFSGEEAFVCKFVFQFSNFNFSGEEAFVCKICISNFKFQFQLRGGICVYNLYLNFQISISAARRHLCVQFVFQCSNFNFSGEEAFVCTICISIFKLQFQRRGCICVYNLYFIFKFQFQQ